ncbi:hypothetical protein ACHAXR_002012, partial [Thalassiosira sp. AJA248-18]
MSYSGLPGVIHDEYGKAYCEAHNRPECHICCLSFGGINEEIDENPCDRDVGVFIPDAALIDWHARMKVKMPRVFPEDDKVFGDDNGHHPYGTQLLAHFDDDPNKPMNCTVLGSRWKPDGVSNFPGMESPFVDGMEPMYVILMNGELSQIGLMDAHMGEEGGWKVIGINSVVNARLDALARAHQNQNLQSEENSLGDSSVEETSDAADFIPLQVQNRRIRRTLKRLHEDNYMEQWDQSANGQFLGQFFLHCFSSSERGHIMKFDVQMMSIAEKIKAFPIGTPPFQPDEMSFYTRLAIAQMLAYFAHDRYGAFILKNERSSKFQAIEFNNYCVSQDLVPSVSISYATDPEGIENPQQYLRGEKIQVIEVCNRLAVALEDHLLNCVSNEGRNDLGSGLLYHEGFLVPAEILPWEEGNTVVVNNAKPIIPDVNFGVELELSCASGNYQQRIASSIAKHAQVDVRIGGPSGQGGKGGGRKGGFTHQKGSSLKESDR